MNPTRFADALIATSAAVVIMLCMTLPAPAQTETALHSFANDADGYNPVASLTLDSAGNLYGTTSEGGSSNCSTGCGVAFELSPASGGWTEALLHTFTGSRDGANPFAGLVADSSGNFYGTTGNGGDTQTNAVGYGTVFKLSPKSGGGWTKSFIHTFTGGKDGANPYANLILDSAGNVYGTTYSGGDPVCNCGVVFKMSPLSTGGWKETLLHTFRAADGSRPQSPLAWDAAGNLYGTTTFGGRACTTATCGSGLVFELMPQSTGGWREKILYAFANAADGGFPSSGVVLDSAGNLYGVTPNAGNQTGTCGGVAGCGVVFKLSLQSSGSWKETVLHTFGYTDGASPESGLAWGPNGNLYGTSPLGGSSTCGLVFQLAPNSSGGWTESTVYTFTCFADGAIPEGGLVIDNAGTLYGTTRNGGANGVGVVFKITP